MTECELPERHEAARLQLEEVVTKARPLRFRSRRWLAIAVLVPVVFGGASAAATLVSKGPVPRSPSGGLELNHAADFVSVIGRDGKVVGYAPRADVVAPSTPGPLRRPLGGVVPVYGPDLKTLAGHLYPGIGFVPLGSSPASVPCVPVTDNQGETYPCQAAKVTVPDVVGEPTPTAAAELSRLGLFAQVMYVQSSSVPPGHVAAVEPGTGSAVNVRSTIIIQSSSGSN
jgi:hypothetical protein